ncbi:MULTISPECIES: histidine--tRNA ligase [unclassified Ruminococcus]|uniref:histidine--tRNA ligase n=1 Tax=unclassified Ruminococcus TaxID=2608920 RepID=UPI00210BF2E9|nr:MULTISPECIES: histidine--tRNA ligase [unclassified Ruminococcus]MCQ4021539.1 histidine--tRNA ligase [Ruminococcus sp. zg-924]MCQ4113984.1 histidine--tRNA ligase [Ruminococcus sp. zg-921]
MSLITKRVYGSEDVLPKDSYKWQFVESLMRSEADSFGFKEIRTPVFEHTELFKRGVGDTTDVVQKEMYTFDTKGGTSLTLRPEGTAGAARALLEHAIYNDGLPVKVYYLVSCYRYEKKQANRYREFHQFGLETYGTASPAADAEMICAAQSIFDRLQIGDKLTLELNSIGCPKCRAKYYQALKEYFSQYTSELCETCLSRLERNPMRILDCKSPVCSKIAEGAPTVLDFICDDCREHFESVKRLLDNAGVKYVINPKIVRGLDYYTRTVFEFVTNSLGAQGTVCGGGRYDGLIEELGGQSLPSLGFALGIERLLALLDAQGVEIPKPEQCGLYIAAMGDNAQAKAFDLLKQVRSCSIHAETDIVGRSLRAQLKYADKIGAAYSIVLGDNEIAENKAELKNMKTGEKRKINLDNRFADEFIAVFCDEGTTISF